MLRYIDSSAFIKYYSDEKGADKIKKLIDRAKQGKEILLSSVLLVGEVISAFDKWVRMKILTKEQFDEIISTFVLDLKHLTDMNAIILEDITLFNMMFSVDYIVKHHLTVNDSLHLYTALIHRNDVLEFICSDKNLNAAAEKEGLRVSDPEQ